MADLVDGDADKILQSGSDAVALIEVPGEQRTESDGCVGGGIDSHQAEGFRVGGIDVKKPVVVGIVVVEGDRRASDFGIHLGEKADSPET